MTIPAITAFAAGFTGACANTLALDRIMHNRNREIGLIESIRRDSSLLQNLRVVGFIDYLRCIRRQLLASSS
jgi:hypothetical protein